MKDLDPADVSQCQATRLAGSFMTLGPRKQVRCSEVPTCVMLENEPNPKDGQRGYMALCPSCYVVFVQQMGADHAHPIMITGNQR